MTIETLPLYCPWSDFLPPTIQFCEKNLCSFITAPSNTFSNLAYIIIGVYLLLKRKNESSSLRLKLISISAILTGVASFLYHASFTLFFQFFDLSAMYLFSSLLIVLNWKRLMGGSDRKLLFSFIGLVFSSMVVLFIFKKIGIYIFALHLLIAMSLELKIFLKKKTLEHKFDISFFSYYKNFLISIILFGVAFGFWILDYKRIVCDPDNHILQGHAIWHILTAFCYLFLFKFYSYGFALTQVAESQ